MAISAIWKALTRIVTVLTMFYDRRTANSLGWRVIVRCSRGKEDHRTHTRECSHRKELDIETLVWTRGRDFPLSRLESRLILDAARVELSYCTNRRRMQLSPKHDPRTLDRFRFRELGQRAQALWRQGCDEFEQLDGFLAAIVCHPAEIPKAAYLPEIWGDAMINEDAFAAQPVLQELLSLVARHKDAVANTLQSGDVFTPVLLRTPTGVFLGTIGQMGLFEGWV